MEKFDNKGATLKAIRMILAESIDKIIDFLMLSEGWTVDVAKNAVNQSREHALYRVSHDLKHAVEWLNTCDDNYLWFIMDGQVYRNRFDKSELTMFTEVVQVEFVPMGIVFVGFS